MNDDWNMCKSEMLRATECLNKAFISNMHSLEDLRKSAEQQEAKLSKAQEEIDTLKNVANKVKGYVETNAKLMTEIIQLRHQNALLDAAKKFDQNVLADLESELRRARNSEKLETAQIRKHVEAALRLARDEHLVQHKMSSELLRHKTEECNALAQQCRALEEEMAKMRSQHEETLTKLAQRKSMSANAHVEAALRQKIAELQECLGERDEKTMQLAARTSQTGKTQARAIHKKFKFGTSP